MVETRFCSIDYVATVYGVSEASVFAAAHLHKVPILVWLDSVPVLWMKHRLLPADADPKLFESVPMAPPDPKLIEVATQTFGTHLEGAKVEEFTGRAVWALRDLPVDDEHDGVKVTHITCWPPHSSQWRFGFPISHVPVAKLGVLMPSAAFQLALPSVLTLAKKEGWVHAPQITESLDGIASSMTQVLDPKHDFYAPELADALRAWHDLYVKHRGLYALGSQGKIIRAWCAEHPTEPEGATRSKLAIKRLIATIMPKVAKKGGAPETPV